MPKVKAKWRKRLVGTGLYHAIREGQAVTVCGVNVGDDWSDPDKPVGSRVTRCKKCEGWTPMGLGPGGWVRPQQKKKITRD